MKKVVVTGGSGRLGQFVIRDLLAHGYQVLSLDKVPPREKLCPSWLADLRHSGDLFEALKGAYGIIHLGAYQAPNLAPDAETLSNNVSSTYNVLRAAADSKVKRVVLASSTAAFHSASTASEMPSRRRKAPSSSSESLEASMTARRRSSGDQSSGRRGERGDGGGESNFTPGILPLASRSHFDNVGCPIPISWASRLALIAAGPTIL